MPIKWSKETSIVKQIIIEKIRAQLFIIKKIWPIRMNLLEGEKTGMHSILFSSFLNS